MGIDLGHWGDKKIYDGETFYTCKSSSDLTLSAFDGYGQPYPSHTTWNYVQSFNLMEWTTFAKFLKKYQSDIIQN